MTRLGVCVAVLTTVPILLFVVSRIPEQGQVHQAQTERGQALAACRRITSSSSPSDLQQAASVFERDELQQLVVDVEARLAAMRNGETAVADRLAVDCKRLRPLTP